MASTTELPGAAGRRGLEFVLVLVMLVILTTLVAFIVFNKSPSVGIQPTKENLADYLRDKEVSLNYRKDLLSIIIAAFGAWVGAGAAYFFGRENLRESANSLLQLHRQMTGAEKLASIRVRDIPPKPLNANFADTTTLKEALDKFAANPAMWFMSLKTGEKWFIVDNDALLIYFNDKLNDLATNSANAQKPYSDLKEEVMKMTLKDAIPEIEKNDSTKKFVNKYLAVSLDDSAADVNRNMDTKGLFLGIVEDEAGNFVQYFTTSDIRKALVHL